MLGQLRNAAIRFRAEFNNDFTGLTLARLDVNPAEVSGNPLFTYAVVCADTDEVVISATRNGAAAIGNCVASYVIDISENGTIEGRSCQSAAAIGSCS